MKILKYIIVSIGLFCMLPWATTAQTTEPLAIPFQWHNGHIIIQVTINGRNCLCQFDTGGHLLISRELYKELNLSVTDSVKMVDSNNKSGYMLQTDSIVVGFPSNNYTYQGRAILEPQGGYLKRLGIDGIIGSDVFQKIVLGINGRSQELTVNLQKPQQLKEGYKFAENISNAPIFRIQLTEQFNIPIMFDTGNYSTLFLAQGVFDWLTQGGYSFEKVEKGYGLGMTGILGGDPRRALTRVIFKSIQLGSTTLKHIRADVQPVAIPLLGSGILQYGEVIIDYPQSIFYFQPFDDINFNQPLAKPIWNIKLALDPQQQVRVVEVWGDLMQHAKPFDRVISINGIPAKKENLDIGQWGEINLGEKNSAILQIQQGKEFINIIVNRE